MQDPAILYSEDDATKVYAVTLQCKLLQSCTSDNDAARVYAVTVTEILPYPASDLRRDT